MNDFLKAELLRFRTWALLLAAVHAVALGFASRMVDLATLPLTAYQGLAILYCALGALLGLVQMGSYRRPNQWLNLLHRPVHRLRIAAGLCGAGAVLLLLGIALPIVLVAAYQEGLTARVVDLRHWLLPLAAWLIACCGYLAGAYAMLANRRHSAAVLMLPALLLVAQAWGLAFLGVAGVVLLALAGLVALAFKPDLAAIPRGPLAVAATALPVQVGAYFLLWLLGFGYEIAWIAVGGHPLNVADPPHGGYVEATRAEPGERLLLGLAGSRAPDAPLWREQVALSEAAPLYPMRDTYHRQQLTNPLQPPQFTDADRSIRWVFSHDRMRFVGHGVLDGRPRGELGVGAGNAPFPGAALPFGAEQLFTPAASFQYDQEQQRVVPRVVLPAGEVFASPPQPVGDDLAALSDRALYVYSGRQATQTLDRLQPLLRVPLPGLVGQLSNVDMVELLDGYLVSFVFADGTWSGEATPYQAVLRVDGNGQVHTVARRTLAFDMPLALTMRSWWLSPVLRQLCQQAQQLFAGPDPLHARAIPPPPRAIALLALALCAVALAGAVWLTRRQGHAPLARWAWVLACGVVGLPALASLWLLYPRGEDQARVRLPRLQRTVPRQVLS